MGDGGAASTPGAHRAREIVGCQLWRGGDSIPDHRTKVGLIQINVVVGDPVEYPFNMSQVAVGSEVGHEVLIDVRSMPPRERHPTIFSAWDALGTGGSILLVNDHDPLPLYYQFAAENVGGFRWDYLEQGAEVWRVRISKGAFEDPGFRPEPGARGTCRPQTVPIAFVKPYTLDVRPLLAAGGSPCGAIEGAVGKLIAGQTLVVLVPFEPVPLYAKLGACGFTHESKCLPDGTWQVEFKPGVEADADRFQACGCQDH